MPFLFALAPNLAMLVSVLVLIVGTKLQKICRFGDDFSFIFLEVIFR